MSKRCCSSHLRSVRVSEDDTCLRQCELMRSKSPLNTNDVICCAGVRLLRTGLPAQSWILLGAYNLPETLPESSRMLQQRTDHEKERLPVKDNCFQVRLANAASEALS
jgi:hypothetical protein